MNVSEFDTLDELKADITKKLADSKEQAANTAFENALIDGVIENLEGEIPEEMFDARADEMVQDFVLIRLLPIRCSLRMMIRSRSMRMKFLLLRFLRPALPGMPLLLRFPADCSQRSPLSSPVKNAKTNNA